MSTALAVVEPQKIDSTLQELADNANREHRLALQAGVSMLDHAIASGEYLLAAQAKLPRGTRTKPGQWETWRAENFHAGRGTAETYMRIARHKDLVQGRCVTSVSGAVSYLRETAPGWLPHNKEIDAEVRMLAANGTSVLQISKTFGVSRSTIDRILDPEKAKRRGRADRARDRAARAALRRELRDKAAKKVGGNLGEAYSLIRKLAGVLDAASPLEGNPESKRAIARALNSLYNVEDQVNKAIGTSEPLSRTLVIAASPERPPLKRPTR